MVGLEAGANEFLVKPVDHRELEARLGAGRRRLDRQKLLLLSRDELREQIFHDPLTGLYNRRALDKFLGLEIIRATRNDTPLSLLMLDLDHFNKSNDTFGHLIGDEVLRESATRMTRVVRWYDAIVRYGGEEFLLIFPGVAHECAARPTAGLPAPYGR